MADENTETTEHTWDRPDWKPKRPWMRPFLQHFSLTGNISESCRHVTVSRETVRRQRQADEEFALRFADAEEAAVDLLEQIAWRWGTVGIPEETIEETVDQTGTVTRRTVKRSVNQNATMLIFMLKGLRPQKYRENHRVEQVGPGGGPIKVEVQDVAADFDAELRRLVAE